MRYQYQFNFVAVACALMLCGLAGFAFTSTTFAAAPTTENTVDFDRDIRPILSENCFFCHGPDSKQRKAKLRLDTKQGAFADLGGYNAVVAGDAENSELFLRITTDDKKEHMPPAKSGLKLTEKQTALINTWIKQGANWGEYWAFRKPETPKLPVVKNKDWPRNPIDHFILAKLERAGLTPSPQAERTTLIRRLSLDLTGLPPTPEQVDRFLNDRSGDAYEKVVDQFLNSPHYGERMAWPWLDAARYADTNGFQGDPTRNMWPWRDWLTKALNNNMPFDQFSIEMLAGDMLPNATQDQKLASAFNRNNMHNGEGGRIADETRVENVFDRTETTSTIWLGLTMTCSRCHDHKYDPISIKEYFQFYAFFNNTSESGRNERGREKPVLNFMPTSNQAKLAALDKQINELKSKLNAPDTATDAAQRKWELTQDKPKPQPWQLLDPASYKSQQGATLEKLGDLSIRSGGKNPNNDVYEITATTQQTSITAVRLEALLDEKQPAKNVGRDHKGNFVLTEFEAYITPTSNPKAKPVQIKFNHALADHSQGHLKVTSAIDGVSGPRGKNNGWAVDGHIMRKKREAQFFADKPFGFKGGTTILFRLRFDSQHATHTLARGRYSISTNPRSTLPKPGSKSGATSNVDRIIALPLDKRSAADKLAIRLHYRKTFAKPYQAIQKQIATLEQARAKEAKSNKGAVAVRIMDNLAKPRSTFVLERGTYNKPTKTQVQPGVPTFLPPLPKGTSDAPANRLDMAKWLMQPDHPLTARVTVNRYWQMFFGAGIVKSSEDFGNQGSKPTHPQLLNWLATQFMQGKSPSTTASSKPWDVKALHKLIVMSATYRQSSKVSTTLLELDPTNQLYARAPRHRMPSWMLRDQALAASGLLVRKFGGPPVKTYQPPGIWGDATFGKIRYTPDKGENLYRRSMYIFWRRIVGPTMFFDGSKRQTCEVKPSRTNTPLHALTTLNDVTYVEAARAMAQRIMKDGGSDSASRITLAYQLLAARKPTTDELAVLTARFVTLQKTYKADPKAAAELLTVGDSKRDESLNATDHAAYTGVCLLILNLDEVLSRE
jgi:hypothetical protein